MGVIVNFQQKKLKLAGDKQIYQFPNKTVPTATDLTLLSDESASHQTKNCTFSQLANTVKTILGLNSAIDTTLSPLVAVSGVSSVTASGFDIYFQIGAFVIVIRQFLMTTTNDTPVVNSKSPLASVFTTNNQALPIGGLVQLSSGGGIADGRIISVKSSTGPGNGSDIAFETALSAGTYLINIAYAYGVV